MNQQQYSNDEIRIAGAGIGLCTSCCLFCVMMPWIICNLVFASGDDVCLTQQLHNTSIAFTLKTWLRVQAFVMIALAGVPLAGAFLAICIPPLGAMVLILYFCFAALEPLFMFSWAIIGAIMFWGELFQAGTCNTPLTVYMFINLIMGLLSPFCSRVKSEQQRQSIPQQPGGRNNGSVGPDDGFRYDDSYSFKPRGSHIYQSQSLPKKNKPLTLTQSSSQRFAEASAMFAQQLAGVKTANCTMKEATKGGDDHGDDDTFDDEALISGDKTDDPKTTSTSDEASSSLSSSSAGGDKAMIATVTDHSSTPPPTTSSAGGDVEAPSPIANDAGEKVGGEAASSNETSAITTTAPHGGGGGGSDYVKQFGLEPEEEEDEFVDASEQAAFPEDHDADTEATAATRPEIV